MERWHLGAGNNLHALFATCALLKPQMKFLGRQRIDITQMLPEDPLKRVDNMTMAWGVEARVPYDALWNERP